MESRGVQQESRAFTERRDRGGVFPAGDRTCQAVYVRRTLYRGRDADRGLGEPQELPAEGWAGQRARSRRGCQLSRREAEERNPCIADRSRCTAVQEIQR